VFAQRASWVHGQSTHVYKWTDDDGMIQYTQYPPGKRKYELVERAAAVESGAEIGDAASADAQGGGDQASDGAGVTVSEQNKQNCITATNNLILLENPLANVTYAGPDGKTVPISQKERTARIEQARKNIAEYCK
jgi:hypothetical protein